MLTNSFRRAMLRQALVRPFSNIVPEEGLDAEVDGTGWNSNDKWTQMLREERDKEEPKVSMYHKKRNAFFKLGYNEHHIPNQSKPRNKRKERLSAWDEPTLNWPPKVPRPTMHVGKSLIGQLQSDEKMKILKEKPFDIPDYRTGDVVKITVMNSITEKKEDSYSGLVISKKAPNSINATCKINFSIENVNTTYAAKLYSPMITNFEIQKYGSNKLKKKLPYIPGLDMSAGRLQEAIIRGRNFKTRTGKKASVAHTNKSSTRGDIRKKSVNLDSYDD